MVDRVNPYEAPLGSGPLDLIREVPSNYSIQRLVPYSIAMLLGFAMLISCSDIIDRLFSVDLHFRFRFLGWCCGFQILFFSKHFVLCTKADRDATRKLLRGRKWTFLNTTNGRQPGSGRFVIALVGCVVITTFVFFFADWLKLGLIHIGEWSESEDAIRVGVAGYALAAVAVTWEVVRHWRRWYSQTRNVESNDLLASGAVERDLRDMSESKSMT